MTAPAMDEIEKARTLALLNASYKWPALYLFKFIVPTEQGKELEKLMQEAQTTETRPSANSKYMAYTFHCPMGSAQEVLDVYARVKIIPGLVSL